MTCLIVNYLCLCCCLMSTQSHPIPTHRNSMYAALHTKHKIRYRLYPISLIIDQVQRPSSTQPWRTFFAGWPCTMTLFHTTIVHETISQSEIDMTLAEACDERNGNLPAKVSSLTSSARYIAQASQFTCMLYHRFHLFSATLTILPSWLSESHMDM